MNDDRVEESVDCTDLLLPFVWNWLPLIIPDLRPAWFFPMIVKLEIGLGMAGLESVQR